MNSIIAPENASASVLLTKYYSAYHLPAFVLKSTPIHVKPLSPTLSGHQGEAKNTPNQFFPSLQCCTLPKPARLSSAVNDAIVYLYEFSV